MIETLIFMFGCFIGLILGSFIGQRRGYQAGLEDAPAPEHPMAEIQPPITLVESSMPKYSCHIRVAIDLLPENRIRRYTMAAEQLCENIAYTLLADRVICPVILDEHDGVLEIGASIYASSNPAYDNYPKLVFFSRNPKW